MSLIIVGLGNPGEEYATTRHNTGRIVLEAMAKSAQANFSNDKKLNALVARGSWDNHEVLFIAPNTFMNRSGESVKQKIKNSRQAKRFIVVHDDLDLPLGVMKISYNRGSGGHRGVASIIKLIKTQEFIRFRVGISPQTASGKMKKPGGESVEKHIMGKFKPTELVVLKKVSTIAIAAAKIIIADSNAGLARAMTEYN